MNDLVNFLNFQFEIDTTSKKKNFKADQHGNKIPIKSVFTVRDITASSQPSNPLNKTMPVAPLLNDGSFNEFITEAFYFSEEKGMSLHCVYFNYQPPTLNPNQQTQPQSLNIPKISLNKLTSDQENFNPKLGMLLLPPQFQFVKYEIDGEKNIIDTNSLTKFSKTRNQFLYSPIILESKDDTGTNNSMNSFHLCADNAGQIKPVAPRNNNIANHCGNCAISMKSQKLNLFYYDADNNQNLENENDSGLFLPSNPNNKIRSKFYLIPIVLSDGMIVYYTIDANNNDVYYKDGNSIFITQEDKINTFFRNLQGSNYVSIDQPISYNDDKSIFVCDKISFG